MTEHIEYKKIISIYFDGEATPQEKTIIEKHISECEDCRKYHEELHKLSKKIKKWGNESLSPDLEQKINSNMINITNREVKKMKTPSSMLKTSVGGGVVVTLLICVFALHNYSQRSLQARVRDASIYLAAERSDAAKTNQYEPYYLEVDTKLKKDNLSAIKPFKKASPIIKEEEKTINFKSEKPVSQKGSDKYEPYYLATDYDIVKNETITETYSMPGESDKLTLSEKQVYKVKDLGAGSISPSQPAFAFGSSDEGRAVARTRSSAGMQTMMYGSAAIADHEMGISDGYYYRQKSIMPYPVNPYVQQPYNTEQYDSIVENEFLDVSENPLSTFSIDVDTASYSNVRRFLNSNQMPPEDAVRIEEMINYFSYNYPAPQGNKPFSINTNASVCPWNTNHQLVSIGLQGKVFEGNEIPPSNLVFLIDVSGSMNQPNKLPLLKSAFLMMANQLSSNERVAIVVYAGAAGIVLESTPGSNKQRITQAINDLSAGGSTAGGAGIQLAYKIARENFIDGGNNRVILATDGDFNVGVSSNSELVRMIEKEREAGIFLTILGFGTGNYKDSKMEQIANKGNGNYYYIDTQKEARKVLVNELGSTLFTIAKDVKIQIEFNPAQIRSYKLIGYENRLLAKEDFNDDTKDAGELGAGHTVTALYEIIPVDPEKETRKVDELAYQVKKIIPSADLMTVKLRYKEPNGVTSNLIKQTVNKNDIAPSPRGDLQFVSAVAEFGLILRNSKHRANASYENALRNAREAIGKDVYGYRAELIDLIEKAKMIDSRVYSDDYESNTGMQFKR
ncbi:MAG TPA: hypothetical protein DDX37_00120 [Candidatus Omnitrophica bacterium]|nr:hypothetical protein [Candidatus Omnitrophota bacterium]